MKPNFVKRPLAEMDLEEIWWYIAQDNPDAADRFLDKFEEGCHKLAHYPQMGLSRDELHPDCAASPSAISDLLFTCRRWR